ncbi:metallophosphoesterase family protein [Perlabentimonas gracilis]|uniref:metallophosphoesterase family protein n=1 Tax=Perlabentimonas gracilis TaxID=2715279 RepID=UPI00140BE6B7|nr:metallophosphoesterase family protein [Perlabentimonas gracilis]NHB70302.1 serine/threonine protein phosphatase [Perlabentimonas gracilis]
MATYVVGDTHGCLQSLRYLLEHRIGIARSDTVILLGDLVDRGPQSAQLIDYILLLQYQGFNIKSIRGNHDQMLLDAAHSRAHYSQWIQNGGNSTLRSYEDFIGESFLFPEGIPSTHTAFLNMLPYHLAIDRFMLVHGGVNPFHDNPLGNAESLLWSRMGELPSDFMPSTIFLYGHTPTPLDTIQAIVDKQEHRLIPLDGGCVYAGMRSGIGFLVALKLETLTLHWVEKQED